MAVKKSIKEKIIKKQEQREKSLPKAEQKSEAKPCKISLCPKILLQREKREIVDGRELILQKQRKYYISDASSGFTNQFGNIAGKDLLKYGPIGAGKIQNSNGRDFYVFPATFIDQYKHLKKGPQTIPLKDIGLIISETGIDKDSVVLESGTGSAAVTCFLGRLVKKVITYELRQDFAIAAQENINSIGLKNVVLKNKDFYLGCEEKENSFDLVVLDLPDPWKAIDTAERCVVPGGFIVSYSPNISQAMDMVNDIRKREKLVHTKTIEVMEREWEIDARKVRPKSKSMIHSGYLSFARKICQ